MKDQVYRWARRALPAVGFAAGVGHRAGVVAPDRVRIDPDAVRGVAACVYRRRNGHLVQRLMAQMPTVRFVLHALDEADPALAAQTVATGPGLRMKLLQALVDAADVRPEEYVLLVDDDVTFVGRAGARFLALGAAGGLDVFQPAHSPLSHATFRVTRYEPLSVMRLSGIVETGPLVAFSPRVRDRVFPFPDHFRMGWGSDVAWARLQTEGFRFGVVDATPMVHHGPVGVAYDNEAEAAVERLEAQASGVESAHSLDHNIGLTWRPWQTRAKWSGTSAPR